MDKSIKIDKLMLQSSSELNSININKIVEEFKPILLEFVNYIETIEIEPNYKKLLENFIHFMKFVFKIESEKILVLPTRYYKNDWGQLYWKFLHYSSILLQYALSFDIIHNLLDFPIIVFNIELILPCPICIGHFIEFKKTPTCDILKKMLCSGFIIASIFQLHNIITKNIILTQKFQNSKELDNLFDFIDFMKMYKCSPLIQSPEKKFTNTIKEKLDFQNDLHITLTLILSLYFNADYKLVSYRLKKIYNSLYNVSNEMRYISNGDVKLMQTPDSELKTILAQIVNRTLEVSFDKEHAQKGRAKMENLINTVHTLCA